MNGGSAYFVVGVGCVLVVVGVVVLAIAWNKSRRPAPAPAPKGTDPFHTRDEDALRGDPRTLAPGDIVEIRGTSWAVRGSLRLTEGSWSWTEHLIDDAAGGQAWLSVEEDPDLAVVLWREVPAVTVTPGPATVELDGRRYTSDESGLARFTSTGTTGLDATGTVRYHDYEAKDGALLSFESYGDSGTWEAARGEQLVRAEFRIYPQAR
ncbi:DUF4178 domain-containing protein [Catenuloplanes atrovinosus]|uniref:DUF4178 domain-containing protein n=1 Tax=Catenuloplanes atrovinosus TaxID=137266 RepID=A0AAE3YUJ0_9ACTN|nr:DUF4178 domain-containing protein [Catenuloplanes atrovinosus]MDR7280159.1 hypothetical protein [Catenuloplanes atrovinosus]